MSQLHDPAIWSQLCYDDDTCVRYLHLPVLGYKALAADSSAPPPRNSARRCADPTTT